MGSKIRLSISCTKQWKNPANLVSSRKVKTRLARPIDARIIKPMHDTPMHAEVGNVFEIVSVSPFGNNSDFTQKCNLSKNYIEKWLKLF